jgi:hypothetical protein
LVLLIFFDPLPTAATVRKQRITAEYQIISDDTQQFDDAFLQKTVSLTVSGPH